MNQKIKMPERPKLRRPPKWVARWMVPIMMIFVSGTFLALWYTHQPTPLAACAFPLLVWGLISQCESMADIIDKSLDLIEYITKGMTEAAAEIEEALKKHGQVHTGTRPEKLDS